MVKHVKNYYHRSYAKTNERFKNYSKWFRCLAFWSGPILTLQLILIFFSESPLTILLQFLGLTYFIIAFALFLVESVIHGVRYLRNN